jgi:hypothetical protein
MAVNRVAQGSRLVITIQSGVNAGGKPTYHQRTYKNLKASAADADVYAVGQEMANLQSYPVTGISRVDENNLVTA